MIKTKSIACIDLGSNSCRLRIADQKGRVIYKDAKATMLGEGLFDNKVLTQASINRGLEALTEYASLMKQNHVEKYRAVATAACRMAKNGKDFVGLIKEKTGLNLEIIDTIEEARLNLKGALLNAPEKYDYAVVYDLGGASTEITIAENNQSMKILHTISIPWGARNSSEAYELQEFNESSALRLEEDIKKYVREFLSKSCLERYREKCCLLATSSTPLRLCSIVKGDGYYTREKNDGSCVLCKEFDQAIEKVFKMNLKERAHSLYIGKNRASVFVAACVIFKTIYDVLDFGKIIVSYKSAQDAMLEELLHG